MDLVNATSPGIRKCSPIDIGEGVPKNQPVGGCVVAKINVKQSLRRSRCQQYASMVAKI